MIGKKLVVLTNLKPRMMAGYESQGMILSAEDDEENLSLLTVEGDIKHGSEIG